MDKISSSKLSRRDNMLITAGFNLWILRTLRILRILIICVLTGFSSLLKAQDIYHLTLEESIEISRNKSFSMLRLRQDLKIAEYNLKSATSRLKTHIDMEFTLPQYTKGTEMWRDSLGQISYYSIEGINYSGLLTINQPLITDGNIYIQNALSGTDDLYLNTRYARLNTRIGFRQPLDAFYGYNAIKSNLKRAQLAHEQSNKALKREELDLIYEVSSSYYNLLSLQKSAEIALLDLERQTEAQEISSKKYAAGLIREVDALQMEVDLAEAQNNYDIAVLSQESATNSFKELLGIGLRDSIILKSNLDYKIVVIDVEMAINLALKNRSEIREQEIQIEQQKLSIKQQKAAGMIRSSIDAYWGREGIGGPMKNINHYNAIEKSYNNFFERPPIFGVGFTVRIPIFDWGENRALVRASEARLKQYNYRKEELERDIETQVRNLVAKVNSSLKRLQLLEKNVSVAEKSFEITRQRFSDGDIDSQSLALERNRLNNAYTSHLQAYILYQLALADLMRRTYHDFQNEQ